MIQVKNISYAVDIMKFSQVPEGGITNYSHNLYFIKDSIYLFMKDTEREAETQAKGEGGCMLWSRPEPEANAQPLSHPGASHNLY